MAEVCITSFLSLKKNDEIDKLETNLEVDVKVNLAEGNKCERCWKTVSEEVFHPKVSLCHRCYNTINKAD
jgi:isoleucyl-tRNA synthetase